MKKLFILLLLQIFLFSYSIAQNNNVENLKKLIATSKDDTLKVQRLINVGLSYLFAKPDSGLVYAKQALELSRKINYSYGEAASYYALCGNLSQLGDYVTSLSFGFNGLKLFQEINNQSGIILTTQIIGTTYRNQGDYAQALKYLLKSKSLTQSLPENENISLFMINDARKRSLIYQYAEIGFCYITSNPDSALFYATKSKNDLRGWLYPIIVIGDAYLAKNEPDSSLTYYKSGLLMITNSWSNDVADLYIGMANTFKMLEKNDSCIFYAKKGLELCDSISYQRGLYSVSQILASVYENIDPVKSIKYYKIYKITGDSLFSEDKRRQVQNFAFNEKLNQLELQQKLEQNELQYRNRLNIYIMLAGLLILLIVAGGLWRKNIYKQKSLSLLQKQKQEINIQKNKVEEAYTNLKSTQAQLIQSEKMASLGELTAGIAHEIQNPLNFVNNFSEVNSELIEELKSEKAKGKSERDEDLENELLDDISQNLEKINEHGKRASNIVKGMLQHSRTSTGQKELTDINALADEYLRLAYHGLRAKDKSFNADFKLEADENIPKINVIPQDIGRVLLNLVNNAFYAVDKRAKELPPLIPPEGGTKNDQIKYVPAVTVSTASFNPPSGGRGVKIVVKDNGPGIPQNIVDKIFQPFFTTKPTGQGTGLGLSLSYDIVKAHGGTITVESTENEGTEFNIQIPIH